MNIDQQYHYHSISPKETAEKLDSDIEKGLSSEEVKKRREKFGENKLPEKGKKTALMIFIKQFKDFLILILFIAAAISWYVGEMTDVYVILGVILFNAIMGFVQEYKAEKAIESIKKMVKHTTTVIRNGEKKQVDAKEVVPGDIIAVSEGESVPADARLISIKNLQTIEASLTGESEPSTKETEQVDKDTPVADRKSMIFKGTQVGRGTGKAVVTGTAENTEIGKIASSLQEMEKTTSAFKNKTNTLAKIMAGVAITTASIVFIIGYFFRDYEFNEILLVTIATLVSSIPEGLPVVISIVLAIGAKRMAKRNAIIREFTATEMLGSVTTILTDKTGTITQSILTVKKMFINKDLEVQVAGKGYQLEGDITEDDEKRELGDDPRLDKMALIAAYCNDSRIQIEEQEEEEEEEEEFEEDEDEDDDDNEKENDKQQARNPDKTLNDENDDQQDEDPEDNIIKDKKYKKDRTIIEGDKYREIQKTEEYHDERIEDGKRIIEEHVEETHKKIIKVKGEEEKDVDVVVEEEFDEDEDEVDDDNEKVNDKQQARNPDKSLNDENV
ncbi:MAG: cation-translocating P-type ATPase, partial [Candidatus Cyclobacteriaceae bacterium M2_1C_046]